MPQNIEATILFYYGPGKSHLRGVEFIYLSKLELLVRLKLIHWALLLSFLAFLLRLNVVFNGLLEFDESTYITTAVNLNKAMRAGDLKYILNYEYNNEHPQFNKLVYATVLLVVSPIENTDAIQDGVELKSIPYWPKVVLLRLISAILGAAAVFFLFKWHPLAGLFLAVNTYAIKYTSVAYLEALPFLTGLLAVIVAQNVLETMGKVQVTKRAKFGWLILCAALIGMTVASKYMYGLVAIVITIMALFQIKNLKGRIFTWLAGLVIFSLIFFYIFNPVLWLAPVDHLVQSVNFHLGYAQGQHVQSYNYPFYQPLKWLMLALPQQSNVPPTFFLKSHDYLIQIDSVVFILAVLGAIPLLQRKPLLFLWLGTALVFLFIWNTKWPQYTMLILVPWCLSAAYGVDWIRKKVISLQGVKS